MKNTTQKHWRALFYTLLQLTITSTHAQPLTLQDLAPHQQKLAKQMFHHLNKQPYLKKNPKKRATIALHLAQTGFIEKLSPQMWQEILYNVNRDAHTLQWIRIKIWLKINQYFPKFFILNTIYLLLIFYVVQQQPTPKSKCIQPKTPIDKGYNLTRVQVRAIFKALENDDPEAIEAFIKNEKKLLKTKFGIFDSTLLHLASIKGKAKVAKTLLENGADKNATDFPIKYTSLHNATLKNNVNLIELLVSYGASINGLNYYKETPLHVACLKINNESAAKLIALGAHVDAMDNNGTTPLHICAKTNNLQLIKILLTNGANKNIRDYIEWIKPLTYAKRHYSINKEIIQLLS